MLELKTNFKVDKTKCIKCGKCINTCSGLVLKWGHDSYPEMIPFERLGWRGVLEMSALYCSMPTGYHINFREKAGGCFTTGAGANG